MCEILSLNPTAKEERFIRDKKMRDTHKNLHMMKKSIQFHSMDAITIIEMSREEEEEEIYIIFM